MAIARFKDLCMDAIDPAVLGPFWAETLRLDWTLHDDGDGRLTGPTPQHTVWFNRVPEATCQLVRTGACLPHDRLRGDLRPTLTPPRRLL